ncbi:MAG: hypothetical protein M0R33_13580 [Methylomonas sp.]|jgi:hypothetical protein|uniref:pPIWI-associating nuclease domain-containing protein n=1 Tax=Methylomonas sp. TaxID=418 RepID=UPI0025CEA1C9|nr:hypothetical protein [Methylomonas sp.]MCK9607466.1 hypothetical protein [Methylomonas sp.]
MKLKKLLSLDFMQDFQSLLETEFEHKLFVASLRNYASHGNPLRFHNFAFAMRELVLHVITRKAPVNQVKKVSWYTRESDIHEVTRRQQLKYCAQSNIADEYLGEGVLADLNASISEFIKEFHFFNKYTHITAKYFETCPKRFFENAKYVVKIARDSLRQLDDLEHIVVEALEDKVHDSVVSIAARAIPESLSIIATNVFVEYSEVEEIECTNIDHEYIYITARGTVYVEQEYGSKDDLCIMNENYPFSLMMKSHVENPSDFTIESKELDVDTSSWYE